MKSDRRFLIIISCNLIIYFIAFSRFSFYGYWTDYLIWLVVGVFTVNSIKRYQGIRKFIVTGLSFTYILHIVVIVMLALTGNLQVKHVPSKKAVEDNFLISEYFIPVGAGRCGFGIYWKTITWKYFPVVEMETERNNCTHENYGEFIRTGKWE